MTCTHDNAIKIFRGDDTNWNDEVLLSFQVTSETADLSTMTAEFILGGIKKTNISLADSGEFEISLSHAETSTLPWGLNNGILKIYDAEKRIKTVANNIPFWVTDDPVGMQSGTIVIPVPEASTVSIVLQVGIKYVTEAELQAVQADLQAQIDGKQPAGNYATVQQLNTGLAGKQDTISDLSTIRAGASKGATAVQPADLNTALATKQDVLTQTQLDAVNSGANAAKIGQIATNTTNIGNEVTARQNADLGLQNQIDALAAASDVTDIVGTYADLQAYDTQHLKDNDIIKVITDSTHNNASSYYRWSTHTDTFTYIGSEGPYTTPEQLQAGLNAKLDTTTAASTYLSKSDASSTYLSKTDASNTYLTQSNAASTYLTQANASSTYLTQTNASTTYLTQSSAASTYATQSALSTGLAGKQETLVSGTNIKTINNESLLGSGNIDIQGGGGGSAPVFTTFINNTGDTLDTEIAGLASKTIMVYKNGILLEKGLAGTLTKLYTGGSNKYLQLSETAPISTADSWEIRTVYKYQAGGGYPVVFATSGSALWKTPFVHVEDGALKVWISGNGQSGTILTGAYTGLYPQIGTTYYLKLSYNDSDGYYFYYSTQDFVTGTTTHLTSDTTKAYCSVPFMFLNQGFDLTNYYSNGTLNLSETKITIDGVVWFDGATATIPEDYENHNCTEEIIPVGVTNDYAVNGSVLSFPTALMLSDKITVGVF